MLAFGHLHAQLLAAASLAGLLGLLGCSRGANDSPPNVIVVTLDTVRADHLSLYGYDRPTTPWLEALAARADVYEHAVATAPWTVPSHASIFTGLFPFEHGAHTLDAESGRVAALAEKHQTLAESFQAAGYRTGAFVTNTGYLSEKFGWAQGFDRYEVEGLRGPELMDEVAGWLDPWWAAQEPFFLFINLMDAHAPYNLDPLPDARELSAPASSSGDLLAQLGEIVIATDDPAPPALLRDLAAQYDLGIAHADLAVGRLVEELEERGLFERTLLVVTSDHGEFLGEHQLAAHSKDVYEPGLAIPLIVHAPGQTTGRRVGEHVSLADIPALIAERLPGELGESLAAAFPHRPGQHPVIAENYYSRSKDLRRWGDRFRRIRAVLYQEGWKLIHSSDGDHELFELSTDPLEEVNRWSSEPERARAMLTVLQGFRSEVPAAPGAAPEIDPELQEQLEALGYR
ncbi:MAG: sulfatase [Deltaproteobacteria bacterium]|nr:sulfatase [Deltaproteobacteria bacterium]